MPEIGDRRGGVRIDGDDRPRAVALGARGQSDGRFSFVATDFQNGPLRRPARGDEGEEPGFALGEEPRGSQDASPRLIDRGAKIGRNGRRMADGCQQNLSNAAVRSAAMSRAFRPSMLRRSSMNTSRPSLNKAICGDDGW